MAMVKPDPVKCFSNRRLAEPIGNDPSEEAEANAMAVLETELLAAQPNEIRLRQNRCGSKGIQALPDRCYLKPRVDASFRGDCLGRASTAKRQTGAFLPCIPGLNAAIRVGGDVAEWSKALPC